MLYLLSAMRHVRWLEDEGAGRALARAETLEACLHVALYHATEEVEQAAADLPKHPCQEDARALSHLRLIARTIAALIMIVQHIKLRLMINYRAAKWRVLPTRSHTSLDHRAGGDLPSAPP